MATLTASTVSAPSYLPADYRYGTDDWQGANALTYIVWQTAPVPAVYAADGVTVLSPAVPGVPLDLTGSAVSGTLRYRPVPVVAYPLRTSAPLPPIQGVVGAIVGDPTQGEISLSIPRSIVSTIITQSIEAWSDPDQSMLIARPMVTDPSGNLVSVGDQPLFVF